MEPLVGAWTPTLPSTWGVLAVWISVALVVPLHHYAFALPRLRRRLAAGRALHLHRVVGGLLFGVIPTAVALKQGFTPAALGLQLVRPTHAALAVVVGLAVVTPVLVAASFGRGYVESYPALRDDEEWPRGRHARNAASWAIYLLGYETMFRGVLLCTLATTIGAWPAIVLSTLAYAWQHLPKNGLETAATFPAGIAFCILALSSSIGGGIWVPFALHVGIATTSDALGVWQRRRRAAGASA